MSPSRVLASSVSVKAAIFDAKQLEKLVYHAVETGETEVDLKIGQEKEGGAWEWNAWALVDLSCRRVYAFKVIIQQGSQVATKTAACLGYVLCPQYGEPVRETRPIRYASEVAKLPVLQLAPGDTVVTDDAFDDDVRPEPPPIAAVNGVPAAAPDDLILSMGQEDLGRRLASIDANLSRIATAMEQLLGALTQNR